jgi:polar amino acid transport system permease protein
LSRGKPVPAFPDRALMSLFAHYLSLPYLLEGIWFTVAVTALGLAGGLILGLVLAAMQLSRFWVLAAFARGYTVIFRGTPLILQMVFAYDALPQIGLKLSAIGAAGLALAANEAPFIAEMLRAGVLGVDRGQILAGQALGMTPALLMRRIIAPQAIRTMIPAFGNETVSALKNSSLASVISVQELTLRSTQLASSTFDFFSIFFASGLIYLGLTTAVSVIQLFVERSLDLDRATPKGRLAIFLPWRRADLTTKLKLADQATTAAPELGLPDLPVPRATTREDRAKHAAMVQRNNVAVEASDLRKQYGTQTVLNGLNLTVRVGEVVALLGPSGSGKSTLLRCINHLEDWDSGIVRVGGRRLGHRDDGKQLSPRAIANERADVGVGMVFQQFNLFSHLTARENIAGPLRWVHGMTRVDADRRAWELLERVGLSHRADALPRHLSGGQQQRVAIARALAPNPSVLLLDEPTSALDPELVNEVLEVIRRLAVDDGLTMIIATHQIRFADDVADRVAFLSGGSIIEEGPAHEVLTNPRNPLTARFLSVMEADKVPEKTA